MAGRSWSRESGALGHSVAARVGAVRRARRSAARRMRRTPPHQAILEARAGYR